MQVHFDIAGYRRLTLKLHHGLSEIGPALVAPETRMQYLHAPPLQRSEAIASKPLVVPHLLQKALRRPLFVLAQRQSVAPFKPPPCIKAPRARIHATGFLALMWKKVKGKTKSAAEAALLPGMSLSF
jgi:hypothetical protein